MKSAIGQELPDWENQTALEHAVLRVLYDRRIVEENPFNEPLEIELIRVRVRALCPPFAFEDRLIEAALDALEEADPPLVEQIGIKHVHVGYLITGTGVRVVRNNLGK
ncbi:MAG TPA: hypothetical protein VLY82_02685 [Nitrososphaerales archaeon]|nr:hypothetical protein [Nitrososphaerales archaeon]